jgi:RimJ/RimL family protein N-acetyltransferase
VSAAGSGATPARISSGTTLHAQRLQLRRFEKEDASAVQRLAGAAEVADTTLLIPHPYPDGVAEEFIEMTHADWDKGEQYVFAITLRSSGELCGSIGLKVTAKHERGELGYWIGVPFWKQGYCSEAARAVLEFAFERLKLNSVVAHHFVRNPASGRVLEKIGMKYEGRLRQHVKKGERFEDLECYSILRNEWTTAQRP